VGADEVSPNRPRRRSRGLRRVRGVAERAKPGCFLQQERGRRQTPIRQRADPSGARHSAPSVRQALAVAHQRPGVARHTYAQRTGWRAPCVYRATDVYPVFRARHQRAPERGRSESSWVDRAQRPQAEIGRHLSLRERPVCSLPATVPPPRTAAAVHEGVDVLVRGPTAAHRRSRSPRRSRPRAAGFSSVGVSTRPGRACTQALRAATSGPEAVVHRSCDSARRALTRAEVKGPPHIWCAAGGGRAPAAGEGGAGGSWVWRGISPPPRRLLAGGAPASRPDPNPIGGP